MKHLWMAVTALTVCGVALAQQPKGTPPSPLGGETELKGIIDRVQVMPGQKMPYLDVTADGKKTKVILGSTRYLIENNFNPKAGEEVEVKGYRRGDDIIAASITLSSEDRTLQLRDATGKPLWRRARRGRTGRGPNNRRGQPNQ